jgi:hypothetical protein
MKRLGEARIQRFSRTNKPPVYSSKHVEYSVTLGDLADLALLERAREADERQKS